MRAALVGIDFGQGDFAASVEELLLLSRSAGAEPITTITAKRSSPDPAYFVGYLLENYLAVEQGLGLSGADLAHLARNSFEASFLDQPAKDRWMAAVDAYVRCNHIDP